MHKDCSARFDVLQSMAEEALLLPLKAETEDYGSFKQHMLLGIIISRLGDGRYVRQGSFRVQTKTLDEALHAFDDVPLSKFEIV